MHFSVFQPCGGNGSVCSEKILAQGIIQRDSGKIFSKFLARHSKEFHTVPTVAFDSQGGNVAGAIDLGRVIRAKKIDTLIEPSYTRVPLGVFGQDEEVFVKSAVCASACSLAFAGGVNRTMSPGARLGVHQFSASSGSIGDSGTQITLVVLGAYFDEMGVRRNLLDLASLTSPSSMHWLSKSDAAVTRLDNSEVENLLPWTIGATDLGSPILHVTQPLTQGKDVNVAITVLDGKIIVKVTAILKKNFFHLDRIAQFPVNEQAGISFCGKEKCFDTYPLKSWSKTDNGSSFHFDALATLSPTALKQLGSSTRLSVDVQMSVVSQGDISPASVLSIDGFKNGTKLLLRMVK